MLHRVTSFDINANTSFTNTIDFEKVENILKNIILYIFIDFKNKKIPKL